MGHNVKLNKAKKSKMDEFFTQYITIEKELKNYAEFLENKVIYCNCDDYKTSNFYRYFKNNFNTLKLKKLICSWYNENNGGICEFYDNENHIKKLDFNGDFRSNLLDEIIRESDIIVTNPPFSLFRDFIDLMIKKEKKFIVLGNLNAVKYKNVFPYIKNNEIYLGKSIHSGGVEFIVPDEFFDAEKTTKYRINETNGDKLVEVANIRWFTNIKYEGVNSYDLKLTKEYNSEYYNVYDKYPNIINCNRVKEIPLDYEGEMGVPINYIDKYNSDEYEIIGILRSPTINKESKYDRFVLKKVKK